MLTQKDLQKKHFKEKYLKKLDIIPLSNFRYSFDLTGDILEEIILLDVISNRFLNKFKNLKKYKNKMMAENASMYKDSLIKYLFESKNLLPIALTERNDKNYLIFEVKKAVYTLCKSDNFIGNEELFNKLPKIAYIEGSFASKKSFINDAALSRQMTKIKKFVDAKYGVIKRNKRVPMHNALVNVILGRIERGEAFILSDNEYDNIYKVDNSDSMINEKISVDTIDSKTSENKKSIKVVRKRKFQLDHNK